MKMLVNKTPRTFVTIIFCLLLENVRIVGKALATKEIANLEISYSEQLHHLTKRMDLETCLGQFDVHKDTIIRTGESQDIGGKYLQGLELDTIEECQRLCCETESCDVYIFESKKDGYCYLFECGTPENFHCKFTRHANYTSAVLTPVLRHMVEVTTPHPMMQHKGSAGISQQEWELSNLKNKPETREKAKTDMEAGIKKFGSANTEAIVKVNSSVQCGRFQFACHSGECIAVYNACDGIPQCEDGSDEGPECPGASSSNNNNLMPSNPKPAADITPKSAPSLVPQYQSTLIQQSAQQQLQSMQQQQQQQQQQHALPNPALIPSVPVVNNREDPNVWESRKMVAGTPPMLGGLSAGGTSADSQLGNQIATGDGYAAYVGDRKPTQPAMYGGAMVATDLGAPGAPTLEQSGLYMPHLAGVQDVNAAYAAAQQQQQQHILLPPPPPPPPAPANSNWQQQAILNQQKQQQQQQQQQGLSQQQLPLPQGAAYVASQQQALQPQPPAAGAAPQPPAQTLMPSLPQTQKTQMPVAPAAVNMPRPVDQAGKSADSEEYDDSEEKSTEPPKKHKHKKVKSKSQPSVSGQTDSAAKSLPSPALKAAVSPVHEQYEIIHQNMALEFRDHDGQSERPGGAVLSLTLGLLITAALAILIGCRMRTVGRRARRLGGKAPYSHEADFLVNGMYL